jgi:thiol-disulfide isomerase/thioredoxin
MKIKYIILSLILVCSSLFGRGIVGQKAPSFEVDRWIQTTKKDLDIDDFKGKVLYIYGFQSWCPGCHSHGFPTLNELSKHYKDDKDVKFVAIQTTFEGFSSNGIDDAEKIIKQYNLTIPVAHSGLDGLRSKFMVNYNTGGTPWTIIVDKKGIVRFSNFHLTSDKAIQLIEELKK